MVDVSESHPVGDGFSRFMISWKCLSVKHKPMNIVLLFLTRDDLDAIPRVASWLSDLPPSPTLVAFANPHLALHPDHTQLSLEKQILAAMRSSIVPAAERMDLEMQLQKRWMAVPRDVLIEELDRIFKPLGGLSTKNGLMVLSESFMADRLPELLTKLRPAWPVNIPIGQYILVFPNQIPEPRPVGRPKGRVMDPETKKRLQASLAKAREIKRARKLAEQKKAEATA